MLYLERIPAPPLNAFVRSIWYCENPGQGHTLERVLPNGSAQLIVNLKEDQTRVYRPEMGFACEATAGAALSGVQSRYCIIDTAETESVLGVAFRPGGTAPFFRAPAYELLDASLPLDLFWGRRAIDLRIQLLETTRPAVKLEIMERTLAQALRLAKPPAAITFALDVFRRRSGQASMAEVAGKIGLSPKHFIERFKAAVGLPPKQFCRILRFQSALAQAARGETVDWTRIAVDCGYFDQAHFIHDFRAFSGITPTTYQSGRTQFQNHVKFLQSAGAAP
jgi:AraC-like DNA-binding protein